jgi:adhesin/invasin
MALLGVSTARSRTRRGLGRALAILLIGFVAVFIKSPSAFADGTATVSGVVTTPGGSGLADVSIYATNPGSATVEFGPTTSASDGSYSLVVSPGTYDIYFSPPSDSGTTLVVESGYPVTGSQTLDVQLTAATHTLSGTVLDGSGNPLAGATVTIAGPGLNDAIATTNAAGAYSVTAAAGLYTYVAVEAPMGGASDGSTASSAPTLYDLTSSDATADFQFNTVPVTVTVNDAGGNPLPGVAVSVSQGGGAVSVAPGDAPTPGFTGGASSFGSTDSQGQYVTRVLQSTDPNADWEACAGALRYQP